MRPGVEINRLADIELVTTDDVEDALVARLALCLTSLELEEVPEHLGEEEVFDCV